ncbi:hypothetical protein IAQ61_003875 [Plenodomus lingam]|uniref:uncharacterized protein n=1 Tax=Leptosphaeria maculans TaxID=5022 RepID=UPI00332E1620|nr:hypothetical protein IAQ61_003875 [Plenodomus lingam]
METALARSDHVKLEWTREYCFMSLRCLWTPRPDERVGSRIDEAVAARQAATEQVSDPRVR